MAGFLIFLAVVFYLVFMVDWKEFRGVMSQGGWAAMVFFAGLYFLIYAVLATSSPLIAA
jgi:hypothetical protein